MVANEQVDQLMQAIGVAYTRNTRGVQVHFWPLGIILKRGGKEDSGIGVEEERLCKFYFHIIILRSYLD